MRLVVEIPDKKYEALKMMESDTIGWRLGVVEKAIINGTPLPKGHGRIGDLDGVEKIVCDEFVDLQDGSEEWRNAVNDAVENILHRVHDLPTIFEADKEGVKE